MNKRLATLIIIMLGMAFTNSANALDLTETGKVTMHGFITQGYLLSDDNNFLADTEDDGSTQFNEIGINFSSDVSERLRMGIQFISRDLGKMGNHQVTIDWASADYSMVDWFNIKAGKIKMPRGLYNMGRDIDMLRTFVFLPQSIYTEGWRDSINTLSGVGLYGYVPVSFLGELTYDVMGGNIAMETDGGEARLLEQQIPAGLLMDVQEMNTVMSGDATITLDSFMSLDGLKLAGTYIYHEFDAVTSQWDGTVSPSHGVDTTGAVIAPNAGVIYAMEQSEFHVEMNVYTAGLEYAMGNTVFAAEYEDTAYDLSLPVFSKNAYLRGVYTKDGRTLAKDFHSLAYYGSVTHRFSDLFEMGLYYSEYYADKDDKNGKKAVASGAVTQAFTQWQKDTCLALRFDLTPNWILKLESHYMDGASRMYRDDGNMNAAGTGTDYEKYWMLYAMKLSYSF